jgi:hypothetical protein
LEAFAIASVLDQLPEVNPAFTRPTANLAGCELHVYDNGVVLLQLVTGKVRSVKEKFYRVEEIPTELGGRAFRLEPAMGDKLAAGETDYCVLVNGHDSSCTCAGHQFSGGCKHVSSLLHFAAEGRI